MITMSKRKEKWIKYVCDFISYNPLSLSLSLFLCLRLYLLHPSSSLSLSVFLSFPFSLSLAVCLFVAPSVSHCTLSICLSCILSSSVSLSFTPISPLSISLSPPLPPSLSPSLSLSLFLSFGTPVRAALLRGLARLTLFQRSHSSQSSPDTTPTAGPGTNERGAGDK